MPTISYIKIFGPPLLKAIQELEKIAIDMPDVCIMDTIMDSSPDFRFIEYGTSAGPDYISSVQRYFAELDYGELEVERCSTIISKSGEKLGEYDFFFEWFTEPTIDQLNQLIEKIDEALSPLGCKYTITTKK
jgi:hypothetical protein